MGWRGIAFRRQPPVRQWSRSAHYRPVRATAGGGSNWRAELLEEAMHSKKPIHFVFLSRMIGGTNLTENFQPSGVALRIRAFELAPSSKAGAEPTSSMAPMPLMTHAPGIVTK